MTSSQSSYRRLSLQLVGGAFLISFAPIFIKLAARAGLEPTAIGAWRMLIAALCLFAIAIRRPATLIMSRRRTALVIGAAALIAADFYVWHRSILIVGAGMATILGNTQVFWTVALGHLLFAERIGRGFMVAVVVAFAGVVLLAGIGSDVELSARYLIGVAYGLATGVVYAGFLIVLKESTRARSGGALATDNLTDSERQAREFEDAIGLMAWLTLISATVLGVISHLEGEALIPPSRAALGWAIAVAIVAQVLGWLTIYTAMRGLPASRSAPILLLQPMLASVWGAALFGEQLGALQILGAALTLSAVWGASVRPPLPPPHAS